MNTGKLFTAMTLVVLLFTGCAHPIVITPEFDRLTVEAGAARIDKAVGYYISDANRALKATTPGGGGDSVEYLPYKDLDAGFYRVLSNVFSSVHVLKSVDDRPAVQGREIAFVFVPTIKTTSSSRNSFFWPPTDFSVTIDCYALDSQKQQVWQTSVTAANDLVAVNATHRDTGLAGKSAATKALLQLQKELLEAPQFRN